MNGASVAGRLVLGSLAGLMLFGGSPASSSIDRQRTSRVEGRLAAVTTVLSDVPARIRVRLDTPASVANPLVSDSGLVVRGSGRFVGFALVEVTREGPGTALVGGRLPDTAGRKLFVLEAGSIADATTPSYDLRRGIYDLYLVPGRARAEVTLKFEGLKGRTVLNPSLDADVRTKALERFDEGAGDNVFAAAGSGQIHGDGVLFQATWFANSGHVATNYDACLWKSEAKKPWALLPRCGDAAVHEPDGGRAVHGTTDYGTTVGEDIRLYYGAWVASNVAARGGMFGQSFALHSASVMEGVDSLGIWLSF